MYKALIAYLHKERRLVVTDKAQLPDSKDDEFEEVTLAIGKEELTTWVEELELLEGDQAE